MSSGIFLVGEFPAEYSEPFRIDNTLDNFYYALSQHACKVSTYNDDRPNKLQSKVVTKSDGKKAYLISIIGENLETVVKNALLEAEKSRLGGFNKNLLRQAKEDNKTNLQPICEVLQIYSNNTSSKESFEEYVQKYNSKNKKRR
jgi:hypothetical protein